MHQENLVHVLSSTHNVAINDIFLALSLKVTSTLNNIYRLYSRCYTKNDFMSALQDLIHGVIPARCRNEHDVLHTVQIIFNLKCPQLCSC